MPNISRLVAIIIVALVAASAQAQSPPEPRGTFVDAFFGPDWDDYYNRNSRAPGVTLASGFGWGVDGGTWGFELGVGVPQWHEKRFPLQRYRYVGPTFGWQQQNHEYESSSMVRRRSIDVTAMARASRPINRRVTVTWLVGGGCVFRPERSTSVTNEVLPDGRLIEANTQKDSASHSYLAAATRFDVEVAVSPRLSIVPRVRLTIFPSLLDDSGAAPRLVVARPEVAVRWRFGAS
jgi:hypothetical protein